MAMTKLRLRVLESGLKGYQVAQQMGIPPARISEYSLGKRAMTTRHIYLFCEVLGCNVEDLVGYVDEDEYFDAEDAQ